MIQPRPEDDGRRTPALPADYRKIFGAAAVSNVGDGLFLAAVPLLAADLTRDPLLISIVSLTGWLPWLLLGLVSGALVDRWDRRRTMWLVDGLRLLAVAGFAVAVMTGSASIALLLLVAFALGVGDTLFDSASQSIIPAIVTRQRQRLERANSQMQGARTVGQELAGPPLGGLLYSLAPWLPFLADAGSYAASVVGVSMVRGRYRAHEPTASALRLYTDIAEGVRWLAAHPLLRRLALMAAVFNLAGIMGGAIFVLFAQEALGVGSVGYGLLLGAAAAGGVLGSVVATRISRALALRRTLMLGALVPAATSAGIAASSEAWVVGLLFGLSGVSTAVFNVVVGSLRQAFVPDHLLGRVISAYRVLGLGTIPAGALIGGALARAFGLRAPFWVAAAVMLATTLLVPPTQPANEGV